MLPVQQLYHTKEVTEEIAGGEYHNSFHAGVWYQEPSVCLPYLVHAQQAPYEKLRGNHKHIRISHKSYLQSSRSDF